jgi:hypothetical protein
MEQSFDHQHLPMEDVMQMDLDLDIQMMGPGMTGVAGAGYKTYKLCVIYTDLAYQDHYLQASVLQTQIPQVAP